MKTIRYLVKYRHWPSKLQRDFMSRNPARQARVRAMADRINADLDSGRLSNSCKRLPFPHTLDECLRRDKHVEAA